MKKICICLMRVHHSYYFLLGALIGVIVFRKVGDAQAMITFSSMSPHALIFSLVALLLLRVVAFTEFYSYEERKAREQSGEIDVFKGTIRWDKYFPIKINSELSTAKRCFGYIYAVLRPLDFILLAYFCVTIACLFINKGM